MHTLYIYTITLFDLLFFFFWTHKFRNLIFESKPRADKIWYIFNIFFMPFMSVRAYNFKLRIAINKITINNDIWKHMNCWLHLRKLLYYRRYNIDEQRTCVRNKLLICMQIVNNFTLFFNLINIITYSYVLSCLYSPKAEQIDWISNQ